MIDVLGPEKRRRRTTQEKIAIVQQSFEPGMTVSLVARGLRVSRAQLHVILRRTDDWKYRGKSTSLLFRKDFSGSKQRSMPD